MNKKIIVGIIAIAIIVVGIIVTAIFDINADLIYKEHKEVDIYVGKVFENKDIESIVKEVTGAQRVIVSKVELFDDMATVKISDITEDQIKEINTKINEKYGVDNKAEDITTLNVPKTNAFDLIKPYIFPMVIALVFVEAYLVIYLLINKKTSKEVVEVNIPKSMLELFLSVAGVELVYFAVIAITRFPANRLVIPVGMVLFVAASIAKFIKK